MRFPPFQRRLFCMLMKLILSTGRRGGAPGGGRVLDVEQPCSSSLFDPFLSSPFCARASFEMVMRCERSHASGYETFECEMLHDFVRTHLVAKSARANSSRLRTRPLSFLPLSSTMSLSRLFARIPRPNPVAYSTTLTAYRHSSTTTNKQFEPHPASPATSKGDATLSSSSAVRDHDSA